jgi:hypothetical protein
MSRLAPAVLPIAPKRKPGISRARRVEEVRRGNPGAWRHGVFSIVGNQLDVMTEVALVFASHPLLDPIADRRLVELYATTNVQRQRCLIAMQEQGLTAQLTSYDSRLAALVERLERAVHEREQERIAAAHTAPVDLSQYARTP